MRNSGILVFTALLLPLTLLPAQGASVSRTYKYFTIRGNTLEQIEKELSSRGPRLESTGKRHPGSTQMEFTSRITYGQMNGRCRIDDARVSVRAEVTLPRWKPKARADYDVRFIWGTLAADIKRHEESHIIIAKNHAHKLEEALRAIGHKKNCAAVAAEARAVQDRVLKRHDAEQDRFDRVETMTFEKRILSLLQYRMEQMRNSPDARPQGKSGKSRKKK